MALFKLLRPVLEATEFVRLPQDAVHQTDDDLDEVPVDVDAALAGQTSCFPLPG